MNYKKEYKNIFFFFIDCIKENEFDYLKINNFFQNAEVLCHNKYFSMFSSNKIDFSFLEKNEKLLSFFIYGNKFFFKNQIKILKLYVLNALNENSNKNIPFFMNFFFFMRNLYFFVFILKKISFLKKKN